MATTQEWTPEQCAAIDATRAHVNALTAQGRARYEAILAELDAALVAAADNVIAGGTVSDAELDAFVVLERRAELCARVFGLACARRRIAIAGLYSSP